MGVENPIFTVSSVTIFHFFHIYRSPHFPPLHTPVKKARRRPENPNFTVSSVTIFHFFHIYRSPHQFTSKLNQNSIQSFFCALASQKGLPQVYIRRSTHTPSSTLENDSRRSGEHRMEFLQRRGSIARQRSCCLPTPTDPAVICVTPPTLPTSSVEGTACGASGVFQRTTALHRLSPLRRQPSSRSQHTHTRTSRRSEVD